MRLSVAPPLRENGFMNALLNVCIFLQSSMMARNHRSNVFFNKEVEVLDKFNLAWYRDGISKNSSLNPWEAHNRSRAMVGVSDKTYLFGVAYFAQERAEIYSCGLNILRNFADSFEINRELRLSRCISQRSCQSCPCLHLSGSSIRRFLRVIPVCMDC